MASNMCDFLASYVLWLKHTHLRWHGCQSREGDAEKKAKRAVKFEIRNPNHENSDESGKKTGSHDSPTPTELVRQIPAEGTADDAADKEEHFRQVDEVLPVANQIPLEG